MANKNTQERVVANTLSYIGYHCAITPHKLAVILDKREVSYQELFAQISLFSQHLLGLRIPPGQLVIVMVDDVYEHLCLLLALEQLGLVTMSVPEHFGATAGQPVLASARLVIGASREGPSGAKQYLALDSLMEATSSSSLRSDASELVALFDLDDPIRLVQTSGTTGLPKKIVITQKIQAAWLNYLALLGSTSAQTHFYVAMPFSVNAVYMRVMLCLRMGATILSGNFNALAKRYPISQTWLIPTRLEELLEGLPANFSALPNFSAVVSGAALPKLLKERAQDSLLGGGINCVYGTNEVGAVASMDDDGRGILYPGALMQIMDSKGQPLPFGSIGAVRVKTTSMCSSYLVDGSEPSDRFKDGWFYPGDDGVMQDTQHFSLLGRQDDLLNFGGLKKPPEFIESQVRLISGVKQVAAITLPAKAGGVRLCLAIVSEISASQQGILGAIQRQVSTPQAVEELSLIFVQELPKTQNGKIRRKDCIALFDRL